MAERIREVERALSEIGRMSKMPRIVIDKLEREQETQNNDFNEKLQ